MCRLLIHSVYQVAMLILPMCFISVCEKYTQHLRTDLHTTTDAPTIGHGQDHWNVSTGDEGQATRITTMTVNAAGALLNVILIIAIIVDPLKLLRRGAWVTILNLAAADLISCGSNFLDVGLISEFDVIHSTTFLVVRFFLIFGVGASFMLLTLLTAKTFVVTRYPIQGRLMLTDTKTAIFCLVVWLLAVPLGLSNIAYYFTTSPSKIMKIYIAQIAVLELAVVIQVGLKILIIREILKSRRRASVSTTQNKNHKEIAKTIIILNLILVVTAFPFFVAKQLEFLWKLGVLGGDSLVWKFSNYYQPIAAINYAANPVLYALRLPDYRRTLIALIRKYTVLRFSGCRSFDKATHTANRENSLSFQQQITTTHL